MDSRSPIEKKLLDQYIDGLKNYRNRFFSNTDSGNLYKKLVNEGQRPPTMLIACCDSRANPSDILNLLPGDAFIARTIANLIPKHQPNINPSATEAALEYAVNILKVEHIILMGHSHCGGVQALLNSSALPQNSFISNWVNLADEAKQSVLSKNPDSSPDVKAKACEEEVLRFSLRNLLTYPWIKERVQNGSLSLHAWRFDLASGTISCLNKNTNEFEDLLSETVQEAKIPMAKL